MNIIDAGTPYQNWIADGLEAQYAQAMDYLNASHMATASALNQDMQAPPDEAASASSMADGLMPNAHGVC